MGSRAVWKAVEKGEGKSGQKRKSIQRGEKGVVELFKHQTSSGVGTAKAARFSQTVTAGVLDGTHYSLWVEIYKRAVKSLINAECLAENRMTRWWGERLAEREVGSWQTRTRFAAGFLDYRAFPSKVSVSNLAVQN